MITAMDDRELLAEFISSGSQNAFRELVERHLPVVYSAATRMVGDAHLAEEVAQAVFTTLAHKAQSIGPSQVLGGWLYNTTRHLAMHALRSETRRRSREQSAYLMQSIDSLPEVPGLAEHLEPAMAELSPEDRDALVLRFLADRALREVGAELGITEEAARKRVSRALERLRVLLERRSVTVTLVLLGSLMTSSTMALPTGLTATIATGALAPGATVALTTSGALLTKGAALKVAACLVAGSFLVGTAVYLLKAARAASSPPVLAAVLPEGSTLSATLRTPDGKPVPSADIYISTFAVPVPVYSQPSPKVLSTQSGKDGQFSFSANPDYRAAIVMHELGYAQGTLSELATSHTLTLQPWARIEGTLRQGTQVLANQTIHLSRTRFGSKLEQQAFRTIHDVTIKTDAQGRYLFARVAPGDTWISWRKDQGGYDHQYRYVDVSAGQSLRVDIGGRGRAITGRAILAEEGEVQGKLYGSVWPKPLHQMRRPENWSQLAPEEQEAFTAAWEKTPDAKLYNQERCPIDFRIAPDGNFIVPDLLAGSYGVTVASWTGAPVKSRMISRGHTQITVPEMPGGRSDEPLDIGVISAFSREPLRPDDPAPLFEGTTFKGEPMKLSDFKGKFVLIHFWRSASVESHEDIEQLKSAQATWGKDNRFVLLGVNFDSALSDAQKFANAYQLTWTQCFVGSKSDLPARYRLRRPNAVLIGPEGLIINTDLTGPGIGIALQETLAPK
ncbi:MAG TPA: sigma-70 family RNA polymerase sigma factor [Candidatus Saccharimonadales bacterium]|nr:sigma-70 family RNA polymerase sigma factor [Candidatus Saccharimonadales bacterium]